MQTDLSALYFEIPARDSLGRLHVIGKLLAGEKDLLLFWKLRDRTFRQAAEEMQTVEIAYDNVESLTLAGWLRLRLVLHIRDPRPLSSVPGTEVGKATLYLTGRGVRRAARRFIRFVEYQQADAEARRRIERLSELEGGERI